MYNYLHMLYNVVARQTDRQTEREESIEDHAYRSAVVPAAPRPPFVWISSLCGDVINKSSPAVQSADDASIIHYLHTQTHTRTLVVFI